MNRVFLAALVVMFLFVSCGVYLPEDPTERGVFYTKSVIGALMELQWDADPGADAGLGAYDDSYASADGGATYTVEVAPGAATTSYTGLLVFTHYFDRVNSMTLSQELDVDIDVTWTSGDVTITMSGEIDLVRGGSTVETLRILPTNPLVLTFSAAATETTDYMTEFSVDLRASTAFDALTFVVPTGETGVLDLQ